MKVLLLAFAIASVAHARADSADKHGVDNNDADCEICHDTPPRWLTKAGLTCGSLSKDDNSWSSKLTIQRCRKWNKHPPSHRFCESSCSRVLRKNTRNCCSLDKVATMTGLASLIEDLEQENKELRDSIEATPTASCDASDVTLGDSPQWQHEEGYWVGEYSLYGSDGDPSSSATWNYPYDHYKGFITGNVQGNAYRQRNVFMYPPQLMAECPGTNPVGVGECGVNGNMKVFEADQEAITCSLNPELKGNIEGPYGSMSYTTTELVGRNNSLLYQVWLTKAALNYYEATVLSNPFSRCTGGPYVWECGYTSDRLMQSQLTTLTQLPDKTWRRTRTAQGFDAFGNVGAATFASFYRERKVTELEFWTEFNATRVEYKVLESDECAWKSAETGGTVPTGLDPGFSSCKTHLETSFKLGL